MRLRFSRAIFGVASVIAIGSLLGACAFAQEGQGQVLSRDVIPTDTPDARSDTRVVDGERHGLPEATFAVAPGTKFLVRLEGDLSSKQMHKNEEFRVRTLEPLEAGQGNYLPAGAVISGHVSRVESAGAMGRAKIWLTFDDIQTRFGKLPIVADVTSVPGDHTLRAGPIQEGAIEGRSSTQKDAAQAAAAGAATGAIPGVKDRNKKEAAEGAALGALEAYLAEAGRGQEIELGSGTKLELELERALYLLKD